MNRSFCRDSSLFSAVSTKENIVYYIKKANANLKKKLMHIFLYIHLILIQIVMGRIIPVFKKK